MTKGSGIFLSSCLENLSNCPENESGTRDGQISLREDVPIFNGEPGRITGLTCSQAKKGMQ